MRSKSTERFGSMESLSSLSSVSSTASGVSGTSASGNGKFVDPLVLRKEEREREKKALMGTPRGKKVPVGQLVAFFDKDKA